MNPTSSPRLSQSAPQPAMAFNAVAEQFNTNQKNKTLAAERRDLFHNSVNDTLEGRSLRDTDVTDLLREVGRLMQHWPVDASGLVLADDISPGVRQALTNAIERAGHSVIDHQPSVSLHVQAAEMKRPEAEEVDGVDDFEDQDRHPLFYRLNSAMGGGDAAEVTSVMRNLRDAGLRQGQLAGILRVDDLQYAMCAGHASAMTAFGIGLKELNEPTLEFLQLAVAMYAGDAAEVTAVMRGLKEPARTLLQDSSLMVAMRRGHASTLTAFMDGLKGFGLSQKKMGDIASRFDLMHALSGGQSAAVTAYMDGLKALGLSSHQIEKILCAKRWGMKMLMAAIMHTQPAALTAFMGGLHGAVLSSDQVYRIVELDRVDVVISTAVSEAYRDGLRLLARQQLITAEQLSHLDARMSVWVQWSVSRAGT